MIRLHIVEWLSRDNYTLSLVAVDPKRIAAVEPRIGLPCDKYRTYVAIDAGKLCREYLVTETFEEVMKLIEG